MSDSEGDSDGLSGHFGRRRFNTGLVLAVGTSLFGCRSEDTATPTGSGSGTGGSGVGGAGSGGSGSGGSGSGGSGSGVGGVGGGGPGRTSNIPSLGPLGDPDANGVRLPPGFTSRIVAETGSAPSGSSYAWHGAPDGGAVFPSGDGGWIYVSNSELSFGDGGVGVLKFSARGDVIDAYSILSGTSRNCAGGPTPWGTWLSCEEYIAGRVWECDPFGDDAAIVRPALGVFQHEAVAVDPEGEQLYLTEDEVNGCLYRFTPDSYPDLSEGLLEVLQITDAETGATQWHEVPDPSADETATRYQVADSTPFKGGEGIWHHEGVIYFTTKHDNRVWAYQIANGVIEVIYDITTSSNPILSGVDNVVVSPGGDVLVAEDGGDLQVVAITPGGDVVPVAQLVGHDGSEITGPAFDPNLQRLYFSSQRGTTGSSNDGITFEITGPFFS